MRGETSSNGCYRKKGTPPPLKKIIAIYIVYFSKIRGSSDVKKSANREKYVKFRNVSSESEDFCSQIETANVKYRRAAPAAGYG